MEFMDWVVPQNEGLIDRILRVFGGIAVFTGGAFAGAASETMGPALAGLAALLIVVGIVACVSGLIGYCPVYSIIGFDSRSKEMSRVERIEKNVFNSGPNKQK